MTNRFKTEAVMLAIVDACDLKIPAVPRYRGIAMRIRYRMVATMNINTTNTYIQTHRQTGGQTDTVAGSRRLELFERQYEENCMKIANENITALKTTLRIDFLLIYLFMFSHNYGSVITKSTAMCTRSSDISESIRDAQRWFSDIGTAKGQRCCCCSVVVSVKN